MAPVARWIVYTRRSYKRADAAAVSDEQQEAASRALIPAGATVDVIRDIGGHRSGATADRDGYQELIARLRTGTVDGIAVYDLSRLHRNAENMLALQRELDRHGVVLRIATLPATQFDSANGRFMLTILSGAAQLQRDLDSERMVGLTRSIFEAGGHRGLDPFGYRTIPGEKPRTLAIVEHEAAVIRRIWLELATRSTDEIARDLTRDGIAHRADRPWTRDAVKDIARRGRFYLGLVTHRRGAEERPGRHPAIIDEATWRDGMDGAHKRLRGVIQRGRRHRVYLLAGLLICGACDHRLRGQPSVSRGQEWRYYRCRECARTSVRADAIERELLDKVRAGTLPDRVVDETREQLRGILAVPSDSGRARRALEQRRDRLGELYAWGHIDESGYRAQRADVDRELDILPSGDRLALFDRNRALMVGMATSIDRATPEQIREVLPMLIERVVAIDGAIAGIDWTGPARPFFAAVAVAPPDGLEPLTGAAAWYAQDVA